MPNAPGIVSLQLDGTAIAEAQAALSGIKNGVERVCRRAINTGLRAGRKQTIGEIAAVITYPRENIAKRVKVFTWKKSFGYGQLRIDGRPLSLTNVKQEYVSVRQGLRAFVYVGEA